MNLYSIGLLQEIVGLISIFRRDSDPNRSRANCLGQTFLTEESPGFSAICFWSSEKSKFMRLPRVEAGRAIGA